MLSTRTRSKQPSGSQAQVVTAVKNMTLLEIKIQGERTVTSQMGIHEAPKATRMTGW